MNDLPTPNIPLLRKAVEWAEAEAAKTDGTGLWNQSNWMEQKQECGTRYCIAGYVVAAVGDTIGAETTLCPGGCCSDLRVNGHAASWTETSASLLGIDYDEANRLFDAENSIEDVRLYAEIIADRAGERL